MKHLVWSLLESPEAVAAIIAGILNVIAIVGAAFFGLRTFNRWRNERIEERRIELAERALGLIFEVQEIFDYVRNPISWAGEGRTRERSANETSDQAKNRDSDYIPFERMTYSKEYFDRVRVAVPSVRAVFGKETADTLNEIRRLHAEVIFAARTHVRNQQYTGVLSEARQKSMDRIEAILWKGSEDPDPVDVRIAEAVASAEKRLLPVLRAGRV
jgi:hypothetical protein